MNYLSRYWIFIFLVLVFALGWLLSQERPQQVSVGRLDKAIPVFQAMDLDEKHAYSEQDLKGQWGLVNIWATWCSPCQQEHPVLIKIAKEYKLPIYGIDFKDNTESAKAWLEKYGNPYKIVFSDQNGRLGFDWGVYGVPETILIDPEGIIRYRYAGLLTETIFKQSFLPLIPPSAMSPAP